MRALALFAAPQRKRRTQEPGGKRPNVLLLMADQHKRTCMGAYGDPVAKTPNLDRLARGAVRFTNAYCNNPVCTPSRASMLTGLYNHHFEAQNNATPFSPLRRTMAHHFGAAGYLTGLNWFQYLGPKVQLYADELGQRNSGSGLP